MCAQQSTPILVRCCTCISFALSLTCSSFLSLCCFLSYRFDDENVTKVSKDDAVAGNYGGVDVKDAANAYMLVYVRRSAIQWWIAPNTGLITADQKKQEEIAEPYPVVIPASLTTRFHAEEVAEKERAEAKKRVLLYTDLKALCESSLIRQAGVGGDFSCEVYDSSTGFYAGNQGVEEQHITRLCTAAS